MKKFLTFSIGLSLFVGVVCGNLFPKTEYYKVNKRSGSASKTTKYATNVRSERHNIVKETKFNLSISAQACVAAFSLLLIGYSLLNKLSDTKKTKIGNKDLKKAKKEKWMEDTRKGDVSEMMKELSQEAYEKGEITDISEKEKKEINEKDYSKLTKTQIKDRQVYGAIRAFAELMKVDGEMHPNEILILDKFTNEELKKLSKEYSQGSDEFKFVWAKDVNVFEALKTYNKKEVKSFFDKLFVMATIDGEVKQSEINFLNIIHSNITGTDEKITAKEVIKMFNNWKKRNGF